ncbi:uncharacterized protein L3040_006847 [Drepanopeziza brunnea f. sp. 'multigermtubi']|uniref:uncharacterized protein n=1 Tax=Drepanopeziza brunnea f. sp. 'multigermtubi' TaxID=698441 RepID=UPI00238CB55E|nr:hypothetical protein L3040_006847 [Drepanopeziza brunnea f. sp. 'multigermtubi']
MGTPFPREAGACIIRDSRLRSGCGGSKRRNSLIKFIPDRARSMVEQNRLLDSGNHVDKTVPFDVRTSRAMEADGAEDGCREVLTLIDLPGLVENADNNQSEDGIKAINDLTDRYVRSSRSYVLGSLTRIDDSQSYCVCGYSPGLITKSKNSTITHGKAKIRSAPPINAATGSPHLVTNIQNQAWFDLKIKVTLASHDQKIKNRSSAGYRSQSGRGRS